MNFVLRRILFFIPALLGVVIVTFIIGRLAPGDPFQQLIGLGVDNDTIEELRHHYGFDQPLWQQLFTYLGNLAQGDLGISFARANMRVVDLIQMSIGPTLLVGVLSITLGAFIGVWLGLWSALRRGKFVDKVITAAVSFFGAMPGFVLSYFMIWGLAVGLKWLPPGGWGKPENLIMPVIVAALAPAAFIARVCRSSMVEVLRQEYVTVARAKGLSPFHIMRWHVLKNGFIPVITVIGPLAGRSITGLFFVERIFGIPGLTSLTIEAIPSRDYSVIQASTLMLATIFIIINLLVDILNTMIDPRTRSIG
ncbi:MAG: ABC transporter permease [Chloroflexi bacterium]|uniref:ABC transporter permease n=1 Tax=Candidatus Chlorohelix allophototropha TaxID=3003348 RepID=A0A8T7M1F4_9CHLR|nr:ABC transporter permease [Chloroflexota bacterium]WJW67780.1 ABC transporter permease [Chloroflexota bacterium L227-S17]